MAVIDKGQGSPIVVVPSLQGRWEYLAPAIDALAHSHRVITFSLSAARGLDGLVDQVEAALDDRGLERATILGISFGGRVALRFAARRPERTGALVLVSVPGPRFRMKRSHRVYARYPRLFAPLFFAAMPGRVWAELAAAIPDARARRAFVRWQLRTFLRAPLSPSRMAARALLIDGIDTAVDCASVAAPTLIVSGEPRLDYVVPSDGTIEYAGMIAGARAVTLTGTGHLGSITKPEAFAGLVNAFLAQVDVSK
jgi:pimeloyl-ACP methyl ester carboxylesterase